MISKFNINDKVEIVPDCLEHYLKMDNQSAQHYFPKGPIFFSTIIEKIIHRGKEYYRVEGSTWWFLAKELENINET